MSAKSFCNFRVSDSNLLDWIFQPYIIIFITIVEFLYIHACMHACMHAYIHFKYINMQSSITDNINIELDKICDWLAVNKLSLNASKSNYMNFHHRQKNLKSTSIPILEMNHTH